MAHPLAPLCLPMPYHHKTLALLPLFCRVASPSPKSQASGYTQALEGRRRTFRWKSCKTQSPEGDMLSSIKVIPVIFILLTEQPRF